MARDEVERRRGGAAGLPRGHRPQGVTNRRQDVGAPKYTAARDLPTQAKDLPTRKLRAARPSRRPSEASGPHKYQQGNRRPRRSRLAEGVSFEDTGSGLEPGGGTAPKDSGGVVTASPPKRLGAAGNLKSRIFELDYHAREQTEVGPLRVGRGAEPQLRGPTGAELLNKTVSKTAGSAEPDDGEPGSGRRSGRTWDPQSVGRRPPRPKRTNTNAARRDAGSAAGPKRTRGRAAPGEPGKVPGRPHEGPDRGSEARPST